MHSFHQLLLALFALLACAFAQQSEGYEATVYLTSTVYRVNTVTLQSSPAGSVANQTSTIPAAYPTAAAVQPSAVYPTYPAGNATSVVLPSGTGSQVGPSQPEFTGAASTLNANAFVVALAAGLGYLVL